MGEATEYRVGDGALTAYTGPVELTGDGAHTVGYRSTDEAGNVDAAKSVTVKVDRTAPPS